MASTSPRSLPAFAVEVQDLRKAYPGSNGAPAREALKGVSLAIPRGSIFGLLGPNGAGKSTLINILAGLTRKTSGQVRVWDKDVDRESREARGAIGVVPQELNFDAFFTARVLLEFQAGLQGVPVRERQTDALLAAFELTSVADLRVRALSGGMRRRLMVAKALVHNPPVLVLDEPTAGVDVELRQSLWAYVRRLNQKGTTILLTTHYLEEAEALCDRLAIIHEGQVVANDRKTTLLRRLDTKRVQVRVESGGPTLPPALAEQGWALTAPHLLEITYKPSATALGPLLAALQRHGFTVADISTHEPDLEDVFLKLTRRG